ncbi:MAG: hypothetical protein ABEI96_00435 [Haloarculaceae archaeon]
MGVVFAFTLAFAAISALQYVDYWLGIAASLVTYLLVPLLVGGVVAMAAEAVSGRTDLDTFRAAATSNYLGLVAGFLLVGVVVFVVYLVFVVLFLVVGLAAFGLGSAAGAAGMAGSLVVLVLGGLVGFVVVLLPAFLSQFFPAAYVIDDLKLTDAFRRSVGLIRGNVLSVLGFDAVGFVVYLVSMVPVVLLFAFAVDYDALSEQATTGGASMLATLSPTEFGAFLVASVVVGTVVGSFVYTYYAAFYVSVTRPSASL